MPLDANVGDNGPEPFIRQKPQKANKRRSSPIDDRPVPASHTESQPEHELGGGLGCALAGLVILVALTLVIVGLFLPPVSLGERLFGTPYHALNAQVADARQDGLTVAIDPARPGSNLRVRIRAIASDVFLGRSSASAEDAAWIRLTRAVIPSSLALVSPVYALDKQGTSPDSLTLTVNAPAGADLYRCDLSDNRWTFVPAHPSGDGTALVAEVKTLPDRLALFKATQPAPVISTVIDVDQKLTPAIADASNVIHPSGMEPTTSGTLQGMLPAGIETGKGYAVIPVIRNFSDPAVIDVATVTGLLQNSGLRAAHIAQLAEFAISKPYQGLAIDYRQLPGDQRADFSAFITALAQKLHSANRTLTVIVPFPTQSGTGFETGAYDWRAIGAAADSVELLLPLDPQTFADSGLVSRALAWATGEMSRLRLQVGLSVLSVRELDGVFAPVTYQDALAPLGQVAVQPGVVQPQNPVEARLTGYTAQFMPVDPPAIKYFAKDGTLAGTMWLSTETTIRRRLDQIAAFNLAGVLLPDLAAPGVPANGTASVVAYKLHRAASSKPDGLALHWMVLAQGTLISDATGIPGTPFVYKPGADQKLLAINAEIAGVQATLGPAMVQVVSPSPSPTITPTPINTPTPTPKPSATAPLTSTSRAKVGATVGASVGGGIITATKAESGGSQ